MSCIILKNNKESILHQKLINIFGEETAKMKYLDFQSGTFLASFGDYLQYENIEDSALIEPNMRERLDENNEPKIFEDETGFYYKDIEGNKSYFKTLDSGLYELFQSEEKIERLTEILSLDFIKRGAFNLDFDSLELSDLSSELSLNDSIFQKLGELSLELNSEVENIEYLMNGYSIDTILTDESLQSELKKKVIEYFKNRQLNYTEDFSEENEEEDTPDLERDHNFSKSSFEINTKDKISSNIRMRLSLMVDTSKRDELFGQPVGFSFHEVYNKMSHLLSNNVAVIKNGEVEDLFETYKNIIRENAGNEKIPYLTDVYNMFDKISNIKAKTEDQKTLLHQLKAEIVRAFNLHSNIFNTSESSFEKISKEEEFNYEQEQWVTIKEASTNVKYEVFDVSKVGNNKKDILNSWNATLENYFFSKNEKDKNILSSEKKQELNEILKGIKKIKESKFTSAQKVQQAVKLLNKVGINVSEISLNYALNDQSFRSYSERTENYHNQKREQFFNDVSKVFENLIVNKDRGSYVNAYMMLQLAEAELFMREDGSESAIHTANKTKWLFSNPSYLSVQITSWKKDRDTLLDFYQNSGKWTQGSNHLKWLLALDIKDLEERVKISKERLDNLKLSHFNVYQSDNKYKDNKTISKQEYIADTINKVLYSIKNKNTGSVFRTTTAPGKSTQFEISHNNFITSNITSENDNILIPNSTVKIFWDYFLDEINRMQEAYDLIQSGDKSKLRVYYHADKNGNTHKGGKLIGNAFKSQILPKLDTSSFLNEYGFIDINKIQTDTIKRQIVNEIKNSVKEKVQKTFDSLFDNNIIEKINENNYNTRQLDSVIFNSYKGDNKNANKSIIYNIAGDLFLNSFINHMEYSKMFAGDVSYYKNDVDYIKRIGATYTDGIYPYLTKDNHEFNIGVVTSVEYVEPYYNQLKELFKGDEKLITDWAEEINAADAQAWITPQRWRDLMVSTSKWSPKHDIIYKKLIGEIKEPLQPNELKKVAQPLKGVYFNIVNGVPTYLKYSQAVLIPDLLHNTELKELSNYMEHHKVDELLTFDAIKAGSPIPTTIHTSEGKLALRNEDNTFKELNTLTLPSSGWKLQQDLPTKTFKETEIGSQIQKNILLLINDMYDNPDKTFLHNDQEYSAEEIIKMTDSAFGQLSKQGLQKIYKEFNISPDGTIKNKDKFYNAIVEEYIKKGGNDATIKALKAGLSTYAMPGVKRKLDNIFMSIMNDRTLKIKTNGGAFIQMSNFGMSKNEAIDKGVKFSPIVEAGGTVKPYTYVRNAKGEIIKDKLGRPKIQPNQILIPGSFIAKYIPNYKEIDSEVLFGKLNPETGQLEGGMIDNRILENIIGYRIPNQGPSSNDALMIAGILPEGMGDTIVAFTGITLKTGSDKISLFDPV